MGGRGRAISFAEDIVVHNGSSWESLKLNRLHSHPSGNPDIGNIRVGSFELPKTEKIRYLCVNIDHHMKWNQQ